MSRPRAARRSCGPALGLGLVLVVGACDEPDDGETGEFIALQRDFEGFMSWEQEALGFAPASPGHLAGERTIYIDERPPDDGEPFPVGRMIVKTMESEEEGLAALAMVKRGGTYNEDAARGWEWFELALDDQGRPVIVWRGEDAPDGECYGCLPGTETTVEATSCNACHVRAADQDYVYTAERLRR